MSIHEQRPRGAPLEAADVAAHVRRAPLAAHVAAMRPRQWVKNLLVAAAPLASGRILQVEMLTAVGVAFVAFCLAASSVYLVNDVRDVAEDRAHPRKRHRPIAAGEVAPVTAVVMGVVLAGAALAVAAISGPPLMIVIALYLGISLAYSLALKDQPVIDLAVVASGFVLRAMAGGVAAGLELSQWFLLAAAFGSLFMVGGKRYSEVILAGEGNSASRRSLGSYSAGYLRFVWTLAATITVATYSLWAFEMQPVFARPVLVQASIAPFLLGVLRYAVDIEQGRAGEPEEIVLRDRVLQGIGVLWLVVFTIGVAHV